MKKVLVYSIMPEHMFNILNGNKTIEVRKRNLPQWVKESLAQGEVVEGYGYCTKGKPYLFTTYGNDFEISYNKKVCEYDDNLGASCFNVDEVTVLNGKVVVKFEVSGSDRYFTDIHGSYHHMFHHIGTQACLSQSQITQYGNGADLYAHHFMNIQPIEPMELREFVSDKLVVNVCGSEFKCYNETASYFARKDQRLTKAPQSFMTAWVKEVVE